jgi:hypothetical protein
MGRTRDRGESLFREPAAGSEPHTSQTYVRTVPFVPAVRDRLLPRVNNAPASGMP